MKRTHTAFAVAALLAFAGPLGCSKKSDSEQKAPVASKASANTASTKTKTAPTGVAPPAAVTAAGGSDVQTEGKLLALQFHSDF